MKSYLDFKDVYICVKPVDFRKGLRSLACLIDVIFGMDLQSGGLFVFISCSRKSIRVVYWDKTGFAMWAKILEAAKFPWPKSSELEKDTITQEQLGWILAGIDPWKLKFHQEVKYSIM
jgi:hypothetical protein